MKTTLFSAIVAILFCTTLLSQDEGTKPIAPKTLVEQDEEQREIAEWISLWSGYKDSMPIVDGVVLLSHELKKKYGDRVMPHITEEEVIEGMLKFAAAQSKSEFVPSVLRGVDTRMLPKGSLLYFGLDSGQIKVGGKTYELEYLTFDLYLGLDLDTSRLKHGGRWRKYTLLRVPITIASKP